MYLKKKVLLKISVGNFDYQIPRLDNFMRLPYLSELYPKMCLQNYELELLIYVVKIENKKLAMWLYQVSNFEGNPCWLYFTGSRNTCKRAPPFAIILTISVCVFIVGTAPLMCPGESPGEANYLNYKSCVKQNLTS